MKKKVRKKGPPPPKTELSQLTMKELALVRAHVKGLTGLAAAADAGITYKNAETATAALSRAMAHPASQGYAAELRKRANDAAEDDTVMSILWKRRFLKRVVTTPLVGIDPASKDDPGADLVKKFKRKVTEGNEEEPEAWIYDEFEKLDPLKAIALDNALAGHNKPQELKVSPDDLLGSILSDIAQAQSNGRERL